MNGNIAQRETLRWPAAKADGYAQIEQGRIEVCDPLPGGRFATINPLPPAILRKNGKWLAGEEQVSAGDKLEWSVQQAPLFDLTVCADRMQASFILHAAVGYAWEAVDAGPTRRLELRVAPNEQAIVETVSLSAVLAAADARGIRVNVDAAVIQRELLEQTGKPVIFASGQVMVQGEDARIEHFVHPEVESRVFEVGGKVNFRNHLHIPMVKKGDLIARKLPRTMGSPGCDVFGKVTIPPEPKDIAVQGSQLVDIGEDGSIVAREEGRPRMFTSGNTRKFDISKMYTVQGNVDIETGNIAFSGDVVVYGNVMDNMIIEALGNVYIYGSVFHSTVTAAGSVHVRGNIIGSSLYSGYFGVLYNRMYQMAKELDGAIAELLQAARQLGRSLAQRGQMAHVGHVVSTLLVSKYKEVPALIRQLLEVIVNIRRLKRDAYSELYEQASLLLRHDRLVEQSSDLFASSLGDSLRSAWTELMGMQERRAVIAVNQCHNSELRANGNIVIHREGVLLSRLFAGQSIVFRDPASVCRGSALEAGDAIVAQQVGGRSGALTTLKARRHIRVKMLQASRICIGRACVDIASLKGEQIFDAESIRTFT